MSEPFNGRMRDKMLNESLFGIDHPRSASPNGGKISAAFADILTATGSDASLHVCCHLDRLLNLRPASRKG